MDYCPKCSSKIIVKLKHPEFEAIQIKILEYKQHWYKEYFEEKIKALEQELADETNWVKFLYCSICDFHIEDDGYGYQCKRR